ncbi:MAG: sugar ABC transporter permease [Methylobacteriaceae bacterium]|nr:sugar ABC transporter permease [Methylobacteriaceae bacterium]
MTTADASAAPAAAQGSNRDALRDNLREYGLMLALLAIMIFFQFATDGVLFKPVNLTNLVLQNSYIIVMALGMLLVIVAGHIDLSVGSVAGFIGAAAAVLMVDYGLPPLVAGLACIALGGVIGASQGYWIAYMKIPSFIVTLAGMLVFKGLALWLLGGRSVGPFRPEFQMLSAGFIPDFIGPWQIGATKLHATTLAIGLALVAALVWAGLADRRVRAGHGFAVEPIGFFAVKTALIGGFVLFLVYMLATYRGLPNVLIVMGVLIAAFVFLTRRLVFGRRIYAMGGNEKAAKLSGINTERLTFLIFVVMGMLAALAGLIFAARLNMATPKAGAGMELDVIAAVFIGGASAMGGVGHVSGAVIGAFIMGVMNNGMSIMGINIDWQQVIKGLVLLGAVAFDLYNKKKA